MNDFQILNKLGEGAYSVVYKVKRLVDGNIYALKKVKLSTLSEKERLNALNEVRILASIKSNFVISYKEAFFDENESCLGIVMEYADKGDLYQKICEFKKAAMFFEESDIWRIFIQMLKGLKALHDLKILHRDLKSANVFLFSDGSAKLGDLNVSKVAKRGLGYTQTGTPYYASPEVWKDQPYDSKSDIWSLGCVLYEMITLRPPFRAENMEGLFNKVVKGQINKIPDRFSADLAEIVKMLIQVAPDLRPGCDQLLKHPIITKRIDYFKSYALDDMTEDQCLLQTIRIPKNLLFLSDKLPQPNYEKLSKKNYSQTTKNVNDIQERKQESVSKKKSKEIQENLGENPNNIPNEQILGTLSPTVNSKKKVIKDEAKKINLDKREKSPVDRNDVLILKKQELELSPTKKSELPSVKNNMNKKKQIYDVNEYNRRVKEVYDRNSKQKLLQYQGNEHIANMYKIYAPYLKQSPIKYHKYNLDKKNLDGNYIRNLEKYYDYYNIYKPKKNIVDKVSVVPNRKLSPIKRNYINIT